MKRTAKFFLSIIASACMTCLSTTSANAQQDGDILVVHDMLEWAVKQTPWDSTDRKFFVTGETARILLEQKTRKRKQRLLLKESAIPGIEDEVRISLSQGFNSGHGSMASWGPDIDSTKTHPYHPDWSWGIFVLIYGQDDFEELIIDTEQEELAVLEFLRNLKYTHPNKG